MTTQNDSEPLTPSEPQAPALALAPCSASSDEQLALAKAAISHVLNAICDDPRKFYLMGWGTGSYAKLTEAHAALYGHPVEDIRKNFVPDDAPYKRYCARIKEEERLLTHCRENGIKVPARDCELDELRPYGSAETSGLSLPNAKVSHAAQTSHE